MRISDQSMREGLLYDLVGRITHNDVRDASVEAAMSRWCIDIKQANRIKTTLENLCHATLQQWSTDTKHIQPLLIWAAMLHELGLQVSHNNYQKHGAYILGHAGLQGFSRQEQALLAALVLSHRSKFRIDRFDSLMKPFINAGKHMCVLLRIAVLLHRGRTDQEIPQFAITVEDVHINLQFPKGWLDQHGMTLADLIKEISYLDTAGYKLSFE